MNRHILDDALIEEYPHFGVPADRVVEDDELSQQFVRAVGERLGGAELDRTGTLHRLMNLRKMGRLPRLERAYGGRKIAPHR